MPITNKEIIDKLNCLEDRMSGNELQEIHQVVNEIKEILLDPEDGIIVRVNKNTYWRKEIDADEFKAMVRWKSTINQAMWIAYTALVGIIVKIVFF